MDNDVDALLEKAKENREIASQARDKQCYHASISRFYYSLFQTIIYVVKKGSPSFTIEDSNGSHDKTFDEFKNIAMRQGKGIGRHEMFMFANFQYLKRCRVQADYTSKIFDLNKYNSEFYEKYVPFYAFANDLAENLRRRS